MAPIIGPVVVTVIFRSTTFTGYVATPNPGELGHVARGDVVAHAVRATGHDLAVELSRSQRRAGVSTCVIDGVDIPLDVEEGDALARDRDVTLSLPRDSRAGAAEPTIRPWSHR